MSRLTSRAPFNRPSVLDVLPARPVPLSPPETELGPVPPLQEDKYVSPESQVETPTARIRRVSTVGYSSGGLSNRDPKSAQKQQRWLLMVMPPASLTREPPSLGHTLSSAPTGRFSNGILMPLFPTLYGQLTAIAREFNMPSTAGLCVYLQLQDNGASVLTPRISDESWPLLWGHFFVGEEHISPLPPHGLPISGRIEFDIDVRRAKWFNTWIGHPARERAESEAISREPSVLPAHWRSDSRTTLFASEQMVEESPSPPDINQPMATMTSRPTLRHLPRPLLLERRDASSVRSFSRHPSRAPSISHDLPSPEPPVQNASANLAEPIFVPNALSPVVQEQEEPQTAKRAELDSLVLQWRQSSVVGATSTALAAAGQLSLDPVNMPAGTDVELDFNDFAWSISSAGPPLESPLSPHWPEPLPSVHLQGRLQGSVCLTPSVCTSFGPPDYDFPESPVSCVSRRPSPDLGMRMLDFVSLTPTTATSWGPDELPSPMSGEYDLLYRAPSVDIGVRGMGSRPVTPSTATSWGPPDSPLIIPDSPVYVRTPDVGERVFPRLEVIRPRAPVFPYYSAWSTQPWDHVWPYQVHNHMSSERLELPIQGPDIRDKALLPEWPDFVALYPSEPAMERSAANKCQPVSLAAPTGYPILEIYPPVYPHTLNHIYPVQQHQEPSPQEKDHSTDNPASEWPDFAALYPSGSQTERADANKCQPLPSPTVDYPFFNIYPSVYPHHLAELYPAISNGPPLQVTGRASLCPQDEKVTVAPFVLITDRVSRLPARVWPDVAALCPVEPSLEQGTILVQLPRAKNYPFLEIYPAAYPYNLDQIYPALSLHRSADIDKPGSKLLIHRRVARPKELLPDDISLYPVDPSVERGGANESQSVDLLRRDGYPSIVVYPAVYPYSLDDIYPDVHPPPILPSTDSMVMDINSTPIAHHRLLEYPDFAGLYPLDSSVERVGANKSQLVGLHSADYPFLTIYPSVYPFNLTEIYGPLKTAEEITLCENVSIHLPVYSGYPNFDLYPASQSFSTFEICPPITLQDPLVMFTTSVKLTSAYPIIELYEPVYPYLVIYPPTELTVVDGDLPLRPISPRRRAPTPIPGRNRARLSRSSLTMEVQLNPPRRSSRSPAQRELAPPLPSSSPLAFPNLMGNGGPREVHPDLQLASFEVASTPTFPIGMPRSYAPRNKPKRTHHELHLLVFGSFFKEDSSREDSPNTEDSVPELPSLSAPAHPPTRQRNRSGTISSRPSAPILESPWAPADSEQSASSESLAIETANTKLTTGRSRRPSLSMGTDPSLAGTSSIPSDPIPSLDTVAPSIGRRRAPSVSAIPLSPV